MRPSVPLTFPTGRDALTSLSYGPKTTPYANVPSDLPDESGRSNQSELRALRADSLKLTQLAAGVNAALGGNQGLLMVNGSSIVKSAPPILSCSTT